jgi:hypothetical protein
MATIHADKTYTRLHGSRRKDRLIEPLDDAAEEKRLLDGMVRCYEQHGEAIMAEMQWWFDLPGPPLPDDDWSDVIPEDE